MTTPRSQADVELLEKLILGQLQAAEAERLAIEYADDSRLSELAEALANRDDTLIDALRHQQTFDDSKTDHLVARLVQRMKKQDSSLGPLGETLGAEAGNSSTPAVPEKLEYFQIQKVLGQGGMGTVYLADDTRLGRQVALKTLKRELAANPVAKDRFLREARSAARLHHDHIIPIYYVGEADGTPFLAMPFLQGEPLDARIKRQLSTDPTASNYFAELSDEAKPLPIPEALRIAREVALGLAVAHKQGLIHRDIKPANIWLEAPTGRVKILDFGLARSQSEEVHLTASGAIMGTPAYMAPEQARGKPVDARADLFSLGCVLYEMLTGKRPFTGSNTMAILSSLALDTPLPPHELNSDCPRPLSDLAMQLLAKDPAQRPELATAVVESLAALETAVTPTSAASISRANPRPKIDASGNTKSRAAKPAKKAAPRKSFSRGLFAVAALVLLLGGTFAAYTILFETKDGTLLVEINDKDAEVLFKNGELHIVTDGERKYSLKAGQKDKPMAPGTYKLEAADHYVVKVVGADGVELETNEFTMKKRGAVTLRVTAKAPAATPKKDGPDPAVALRFDLSNDGVKLPGLEFDAAKPGTLELWIDAPGNLTVIPVLLSGKNQFLYFQFTDTGHFQLVVVPHAAVAGQKSNFKQFWVQAPKGLTHIAACWNGRGEYQLFVNGRSTVAPVDRQFKFETSDLSAIGPEAFGYGVKQATGSVLDFRGLRLSRVARYQSDFTPRTRFAADADTLALYHFDEGQGDVLTDSSGNNHHGKIVGAKWVKADEAKSAAAAEPVNVLALVDAKRDTFHGRWKLADGKLVGGSDQPLDPWTEKLQVPFTPPAEYDLTMVVERTAVVKSDFPYSFGLTLAGTGFFQVIFDWREPDQKVINGLQRVDGKVFLDPTNPTRTEGDFFGPKGGPIRITCRVRKDSVAVLTDDQVRFSWKGDVSKLDHDQGFFRLPDQTRLAVAVQNAEYHISEWKVTPVGAIGPKTSPTKPDYALEFDGKSSYVDIPSLKFVDDQPATIEGFVTVRVLQDPMGFILFNGTSTLSLTTGATNWAAQVSKANLRVGRIASNKIAVGERMHVAAVWTGRQLRLYLNGTAYDDQDWQPGGPSGESVSTKIGRSTDIAFMTGIIDEVCFSKVARYDKNFTPAQRFDPDADTLALYHFDEGQGDILKDSSGHNHHGKIVGAKWVKAVDTSVSEVLPGLRLESGKDSVKLANLPFDHTAAGTFELWVQDMIGDGEAIPIHLGGAKEQVYLQMFRGTLQLVAAPATSGLEREVTCHLVTLDKAPAPPYHVAGSWAPGTLPILFVNGKAVAKRSDVNFRFRDNTPTTIGYDPQLTATPTPGPCSFVVRDVRISRGVRYKTDFSPTRTLLADKDTVAYFPCDDGQGDVLKDASGNKHDGKIVGAKWVKVDGPARDRAAAEWVFSIGGKIEVWHDAVNVTEYRRDQLATMKFEKLNIVLNDVKSDETGLKRLRSLRSVMGLHMMGWQLTDEGWKVVASMPNLTTLGLTLTTIDDSFLLLLKDKKSIAWLNLVDTAISDASLPTLLGFEDLTYLGLQRTKVTAAGVKKLAAALPQCRIEWDGTTFEPKAADDRKAAAYVVSIGGALRVNGQVGDIKADAGLPREPFRLTSVDLRENKRITDTGMAQLKDCKNLGTLLLGDTQVGDPGLAYMKECRHLTQLYLENTKLSNAGLIHFKDCKNLKELCLSNTQVTNEGLAHFKNCKSLTQLYLIETTVGDPGLACFKECKDLTILHLRDTQVSDEGIGYFKNCKDLKYLSLQGTRVSNLGLAKLKECKSLTEIYLKKTKVTAAGIDELRAALPQCKIEWDGPTIEPKP